MITLRSHLAGRWADGSGDAHTLVNPATEEPLARVAGGGWDLAGAVDFARRRGGPGLRELSFARRGELLKAMCDAFQADRKSTRLNSSHLGISSAVFCL